jgi:hypothetical protein
MVHISHPAGYGQTAGYSSFATYMFASWLFAHLFQALKRVLPAGYALQGGFPAYYYFLFASWLIVVPELNSFCLCQSGTFNVLVV